MFERHLTAEGLDLVRSGAIQPRDLQLRDPALPADIWADPEFKPYVASRFAACPSGLGSQTGHATDIAGRLPAGAQPLLRGKELRAYSNDLFSDSDLFPPDSFWPHPVPMPPDPPVECFEVSTEEAIVLFKTLRRAGFAFEWVFVIGDQEATRLAPPPPWAGAVHGPCGGLEQPAAMEVCFRPLLPHGQWYEMPGYPQRFDPRLLLGASRPSKRSAASSVRGRGAAGREQGKARLAVARDAVGYVQAMSETLIRREVSSRSRTLT